MDKYFKGKRILVTGGCQGIGRGIALELWRQGANVVVLSNQPANLEKLKKEYPSLEIACVDLLDWDKTRETVDSLGTFDGLVNSAGIAIIESFFECSPDSFDKIMVRKYKKEGTRNQEMGEESTNLAIDNIIQGRLSYRKAAWLRIRESVEFTIS